VLHLICSGDVTYDVIV